MSRSMRLAEETRRFFAQFDIVGSRYLPLKCIDFLATCVAHQQQRIIWPETGPRSKLSPEPAQPLQASQSFQLAIRNPHAKECGVVGQGRVEVQVMTIMGP